MRLTLLISLLLAALPFRAIAGNDARAASYDMIFHNAALENDPSLPIKCGLPALSYAIEHRDSLSPDMKTSLVAVLANPQAQKSVVIGKFRINYDTTGTNEAYMLNNSGQRIPGTADMFADSVGAIANYAASFETDGALGYQSPFNPDGSPYDIYVEELGSLYGFTTPLIALDNKPAGAGGRFTTSITIDNDFIFVTPDSNKGLPAMRVTLAHEFFHAIQIGQYGYWTSDRYYYEISSVWMEDEVYTGVNDYVQYLGSSQSQFLSPETPFTSNQSIMYSRGIWGLFVEKRFGRDVIRRSWEEIANVRPLDAIDRALNTASSNFRLAFSEWTLWNFFTGTRSDPVKYYPEGKTYPLIREATRVFTPPASTVPGSLKGLSAQYYDILTSSDTLTLALANINMAGTDSSFGYEYSISSTQLDDGYKPTAGNVFVKLVVSDISNWQSWDIHKGSIGPVVSSRAPFPNPFLADGRKPVYIPVNATTPVSGTLTIFSSSMDLVYSAAEDAVSPQPGTWTFFWNGTTSSNSVAASGLYIYVVEIQGQLQTGKIALIRE